MPGLEISRGRAPMSMCCSVHCSHRPQTQFTAAISGLLTTCKLQLQGHPVTLLSSGMGTPRHWHVRNGFHVWWEQRGECRKRTGRLEQERVVGVSTIQAQDTHVGKYHESHWYNAFMVIKLLFGLQSFSFMWMTTAQDILFRSMD